MKDCEFLESCPIFKKYGKNQMDKWSTDFCKGVSEKCARKKLRLGGYQVPTNLLPDGKSLQTLE